MATHRFKNKKYFIGLLLGLFFLPLFSFAQFITTNAPCEPEIIPPYGQVGGVYCPYCPNKGEYVHLKWDLKANFQEPVCDISCWTPTGNQCTNWPDGRLFDDKGKPKTNLKPKDDVFVKRPGTGLRTGPGINYQISCHEKKNPKLSQLSSGIRVVSDCEATGVCEERKFSDIISDLDNYKPTVVTERNVKEWTKEDLLDRSHLGSGSGDIEDIKDYIVSRQCSPLSVFTNKFNEYSDLNLQTLSYFKEATKNNEAVPITLVYFVETYLTDITGLNLDPVTITKLKELGFISYDNKLNIRGLLTGGHAVLFLGITSHDKDYSRMTIKILDSNFDLNVLAPAVKEISCQKKTWQAKMLSFSELGSLEGASTFFQALFPGRPDYSLSPYIMNDPGIFRSYYYCSDPFSGKLFIPFSTFRYSAGGTDLELLKSKAVRGNTSAYLGNPSNYPSFSNFSSSTQGAERGVCAGWSDFVLRTAYLSEFQGVDCHPDGTVSKLFNNSRLLSAISLFSKDLTNRLFNLDK